MFIGREYELDFLNERYASNHAELIVLYGRRRVGKTELLTEFCKGKKHIFFTCNEYTDGKQLEDFSRKILSFNDKFSRLVKRFCDWESAFLALGEIAQDEKLVIIIDEFPYMVKGNNSIPSVLQNLWDHNLKNKNIMIILSGSSMSFIENEILGYKNPLYGRATGIYKLEALPYFDAIKFFPNYTDEDKAIAYSILGGIPHYLSQFDPDISLEENIKNKILKKSSQLYDEVEFLLHQELREPAIYVTIIESIALGCSRYSEIADKSGIDSARLSTYLKNLLELGIVKKELPALSKSKDTIKRNLVEYVLSDNLFRFYYKYVYPHKAELETNNVELVWKYIIKNDLHHFAARAFEDICIRYLYVLAGQEKLPSLFTSFARWWGKVTRKKDGAYINISEELDILGTDVANKSYLVGECKFTNECFDLNQLNKLREKLYSFDGNIYLFLFALNGFTEAVINEARNQGNIYLFTLTDVFSL